MCSFISNFFIQLCFPTASHNYGNQLEEKLGLIWERMNNKNMNIFLHIHTFGSMKQYIFPVNEETFKAWKKQKQKQKHKQNKEKSAHMQPSATSHHLPAAWNTDTVWGAGSGRGSQKVAQLPFTTTRYVISLHW